VGQAAKTPSQSAAVESQTERTTISLRLCAFARVKKKYFAPSNSAGLAPVILRGRLQSREGAKPFRLSAAGRP